MLYKLSDLARQGIKTFCDHQFGSYDLSEVYTSACNDAEMCARLYFPLRSAEDKPEWFPCGKWATLQKLEKILDSEFAKEYAPESRGGEDGE
ncbi:MAG TPA: hypothetical protein VJ801_14365 [Polyangia bacterium]|jgi:hypothetical protein|nr:hypothetical protein [Polyangia bacterium]